MCTSVQYDGSRDDVVGLQQVRHDMIMSDPGIIGSEFNRNVPS